MLGAEQAHVEIVEHSGRGGEKCLDLVERQFDRAGWVESKRLERVHVQTDELAGRLNTRAQTRNMLWLSRNIARQRVFFHDIACGAPPLRLVDIEEFEREPPWVVGLDWQMQPQLRRHNRHAERSIEFVFEGVRKFVERAYVVGAVEHVPRR